MDSALEAYRKLSLNIGEWCPTNQSTDDGTISYDILLLYKPEEHSKDSAYLPYSFRTK